MALADERGPARAVDEEVVERRPPQQPVVGGVSHTKEEDTPIEDIELSVLALDGLTRRTLAWAQESNR